MRKIFLSVENGPAVTELEGAYMKYITLLRLTLPVGLNVVGSMLGCNVGDVDVVGSNDVGSEVVGFRDGANDVGLMLGCNVGIVVGSNDVGSEVVGLPVVGLGVG